MQSLFDLSAKEAVKSDENVTVLVDCSIEVRKHMTEDQQLEHFNDYKEWNVEGKLIKHSMYVDGIKHMTVNTYDGSDLESIKTYVNGSLHGKQTYWYQGILWKEEVYSRGSRHGDFKEWCIYGNQRGDLIKHVLYGYDDAYIHFV
jgi:antitoxin component YwqK of YwqJK toxin-antitoxin module